jgi:hypothetical protein
MPLPPPSPRCRWAALALGALLAACAGAPPRPAKTAEPGVVSVTTADPAQFSEARDNPRETAGERRAWVDALSGYLSERAADALAPGQRLEVRIADVRRAAPPGIELDYTLRAADGRVLREGRRHLHGSGPPTPPGAHAGDPLQHEKRLVDGWVEHDLAAAQ